jgi:uncharacterized protein YjbI with pentapeptide repeats/type II secretory pathway pseudopilin PulG
MKLTQKTVEAFTLVEVLGATAVLATLATLSIVSIKDTVQAGQKASAQREIQNLNATLENFKSAGGVIPEDATASVAIDALQSGVDMAGSEYAPLASVPEEEIQIAGEAYSLDYNPEDGFSYVKDGGGDLIGGSGSSLVGAGSSGAGSGYVPGVTPVTPENVNAALAALASSTPGTPEYDAILADLAVALASGDLSAEATAAVTASALSEGLTYDGALGWNPDASYLPDSGPLLATYNGLLGSGSRDLAMDYFKNLSSLEQTSLYRALVEVGYPEDPEAGTPSEAGTLLNILNQEGKESLLANLPAGEAGEALNMMDLVWYTNLSGLDLTGWETTGKRLDGVNLVGSNVTAAQLNAADRIFGANLSGLDLTGWDTTGKNLGVVNLVGSNVTVAQLNGAGAIQWANLSGLDLTGWETVGKSLSGVNLVGSNVTVAQLNGASWIGSTNLSGTGITRADLEASGKWSASLLNTITF